MRGIRGTIGASMLRGRLCAVIAAVAMLTAAPAAGGGERGRLMPAGADYVPTDADERGLWAQLEAYERKAAASGFLIRDPALNLYVRGILCRTVGAAPCRSLRLYIMRDPTFNASMAPNGMVTVHTGLLLRSRNEAQLATVLGHEYGHFVGRHGIRTLRDRKVKAGQMALLSSLPARSYGAALAIRLAQIATTGSQYSFSRDMEREADAASIPLMAAAGYDPAIAATIWQDLLKEDAAALAARRRRIEWRENRFFATHPARRERIEALSAAARSFAGGRFADDGAKAYRAAMAPFWPQMIDDQIKLNDFGGSDWLIKQLATDGWTPALLYARGELYRTRGRPDDLKRAAGFYHEALEGDAPVEAWRGLGLVSLRDGDAAVARQALQTYLARKPDAADRAMIAMLAADP